MRLIHYGASKYDPAKFRPIKNEWVKPSGGLWASPVGSECGWESWCQAEQFRVNSLKESFEFEIRGRIFTIDCEDDLSRMPWRRKESTPFMFRPDFEAMAEEYDAIHLTSEGQWRTRHSHPRNLYGWDCECVLVMNPAIIRVCDPVITQ